LFDKTGEEYQNFVGSIVASRRHRLTKVRAAQEAEIVSERHRAELALTRQEEVLRGETQRRQEAEAALAAAETELRKKSEAVHEARQEGTRKALLAALLVPIALGMVACAAIGQTGPAIFLLLAALIAGGTGWGWATRDAASWPVAVSTVVAGIGGIWALFF
jgi:hypothetical protein